MTNVIEMPKRTKTDDEKVEIPPREELVKRARFICALGVFTKPDERTMIIESEEIGNIETKTIVRRGERNIALCNCPVYLSATEGAQTNLRFCCEHKIALAVRGTLPKPSQKIHYNPAATSIETMIEANQRTQLKKLARDLEILDGKGEPRIDEISWKRLGCEAGDLSREAAQFLIDYLLEVVNFENSNEANENAA